MLLIERWMISQAGTPRVCETVHPLSCHGEYFKHEFSKLQIVNCNKDPFTSSLNHSQTKWRFCNSITLHLFFPSQSPTSTMTKQRESKPSDLIFALLGRECWRNVLSAHLCPSVTIMEPMQIDLHYDSPPALGHQVSQKVLPALCRQKSICQRSPATVAWQQLCYPAFSPRNINERKYDDCGDYGHYGDYGDCGPCIGKMKRAFASTGWAYIQWRNSSKSMFPGSKAAASFGPTGKAATAAAKAAIGVGVNDSKESRDIRSWDTNDEQQPGR